MAEPAQDELPIAAPTEAPTESAEPAPKKRRNQGRRKAAPKPEPEADEIPTSFSTDGDDDFSSEPAREKKPAREAPEANDDRGPADSEPKAEKNAVQEDARKSHSQDGKGPEGGNPQRQQGNRDRGPRDRNQRFQKGGKHHQKGQKGKPHPQQQKKKKQRRPRGEPDILEAIELGDLPHREEFASVDAIKERCEALPKDGEAFELTPLLEMPLLELVDYAKEAGIDVNFAANRQRLLSELMAQAIKAERPLYADGIIETREDDDFGLVVYPADNYRVRPLSIFVPAPLMEASGIERGQLIRVRFLPDDEGQTCPVAIEVVTIMDKAPEENLRRTPFEDLVPYYPTSRILLESEGKVVWDNLSMRVLDLLTPIGFGQRGLIVAPPRTGKTILLQGIANAVAKNSPDAHLIVLLVDERPEEVTDFKRQVKGEVVSSTFDQSAESHVHAAEMVIEKARRMVQDGRDVVILLDSITRLARAYNTLMPSSGKILSGGVEASALQKPKRFFGSARNIEDGGSLTILGTALVETGSRMDEVIFEEFKGTGNMEIHLDRALVEKRVFPAFNLEKSGTRKEELLYHPEEIQKVYGLRRAMKGVPATEAMEMLIQRMRKTKSNVEFLMSMR